MTRILSMRVAARRTGLLVAALVLVGCASRPDSTCGLDEAARERATALVKAMVERGHAPGVVADIRCDGRPWLMVAAGQADPARQRPSRQNDLFRIYSMTKPVTAVAVLMLADDGRLALDDPVSRHLPEFANATVYDGEKDGAMQTQPLSRPLTVRDLLRHSAGIPYGAPVPHPVYKRYIERGIDNGSGQVHQPSDGSAPIGSAAELSQRIAAIPLLHQPGERYTYGGATDIAGRLVEAVSGQTLGDFLQRRLFTPLGMKDTHFLVPAAATPRMTAAFSAPSQRPGDGSVLAGQRIGTLGPSKLTQVDAADNSVFSRPRPMHFGGAGLVSTAADYQRFALLLMTGGQGLVRPATLAEMTRNQLGSAALQNSSLGRQGLGYGLGIGVIVEPEKFHATVPRDGVFWGGAASTFFWVDRERRISGVLMTQVFGGDAAPYFVELVDAVHRSTEPVAAASK